MYGIQTKNKKVGVKMGFENDVKMYGIQTIHGVQYITLGFENDVKMYGIQTNSDDMFLFHRLRMM